MMTDGLRPGVSRRVSAAGTSRPGTRRAQARAAPVRMKVLGPRDPRFYALRERAPYPVGMRETLLSFFRPSLSERDVASVVDAVRDGRVGPGPTARAFETRFAARARVKHAVALSGAAAGVRLVLAALGVGAGDEVVVAALSSARTAHAVRACGATLVPCDVDEETLCATARSVEAAVTERTRAIVVTPYAGRPARIAAIAAFARRHGIAVLEDAVAVGMLDDGRWAGVESDAALYGFSPADTMTTGNGAMLATNDDALAERVRRLASASEGDDQLPDLNAALGLSQLDRAEALHARREEIVAQYLATLETIDGVEAAAIGRIGLRDRHSWSAFPIVVDPACGLTREELADALRGAKIGVAVHQPLGEESALPVSARMSARMLCLPLSAEMTDDDVDDVIAALLAAASRVPAPA